MRKPHLSRLRTGFPRGVVAVLGLLAPMPAWSSDGVLQINHACASGAGCFSGDAAGYPVEIYEPGSYRLTGDLTVPSANTDAIRIETDDVTVDLNGFALRGPTICSGNPLTCTGGGSGVGVRGEGRERVAVRNGVVTGMGANGLSLGRGALVKDVELSSNGGTALVVRQGSTVADVIAQQNGGAGILANPNSTVADCAVRENGSHGISVGNGASLRRGSASDNDGAGIVGGFGASIADVTALRNGDAGLRPSIAVVSRAATHSNALSGVYVYQNGGAALSQLTARGNAEYGLDFALSNDSGYGTSVVSGNTIGTVRFDGVALDHDLCNGSAPCP